MKKRTKLIAVISSFCLVLALGIMGVLAVTDLTFNMGGTVTFSAEGLTFTVSQGRFETTDGSAYPMEMTGKMQSFTMNTDKTLEDVEEQLDSWSGLVMTLSPDHGDAILEFDVTNNTPDTSIQVVITMVTPAENLETSNIEFLVEGATIPTTETKTCKVTFNIKNEEVNVAMTNFEIKVDIIPALPTLPEGMFDDTANQYYYVEMGTYNDAPIRWRYVSADFETPYAYGTFPTSLKGYYILETEIFDAQIFCQEHDERVIYCTDYALSSLRSYITGEYFLTKYVITESDPIYNMIEKQSMADLYADLDIPADLREYFTSANTDPTFNTSTDKFFIPSISENDKFGVTDVGWCFNEDEGLGSWFRTPSVGNYNYQNEVYCWASGATFAGTPVDFAAETRPAFIIE